MRLKTMPFIYNQAIQPSELIRPALKWLENGHQIILVTLINIEGNAPYPVGSQMLINEHSEYIGQITGGCAESAIADQAVMVMNKGANLVQRYGLDSPFFDIKLPCGSGIDVYFDCLMTQQKLELISATLEQRKDCFYDYETSQGAFTKVYKPTPRLILLGQGPILVVLAELAIMSGFDVACIAQNIQTETLLSQAGLKSQPLSHSSDMVSQELDCYTAMISLFHEHELEIGLLMQALETDAFYLGALGSRRTHVTRLESLIMHGVERSQLARLRGPVGLDIGANSPAQIAVSILAEVIAEMNSID